MPEADAESALSRAYEIISSQPQVLYPALIGAAIPFLVGLAQLLVLPGFGYGFPSLFFGFHPAFLGLVLLFALAGLIGLVVMFVMSFASIEMSRRAYLGEATSVSESVSYVLDRIGTIVVAAIVGGILSVTVVLIPVVILMFVVIVVEETGISDALSKSFEVAGERLGPVVILAVVAIVGGGILNLIPIIGSLILAAWYVLIGLSFMHIYFDYRGQIQ